MLAINRRSIKLMLMTIKNEQEFYIIARNFYNNSAGNTEDQFQRDLRLIGTLKTYLKKYEMKEDYDLRAILNIYITLTNIFGMATEVILRYRCPANFHPYLAVLSKIMTGKQEDPDVFSYEFYREFKNNL